MNAYDVRKALRSRYSDHRRYAVAEEVGLTTGAARRRLDMIVADCYASNGFRVDGFEIKVSTADLRRELEDPDKHIAFFDVIDYYTLACPAKVMTPDVLALIPKKWGIFIVYENGTTKTRRRPLALQDIRPEDRRIPRGFFASFVRSIQEMQPSEQELKAEYKKGLEEGEEQFRRRYDFQKDYVRNNMAKLEQYDKLMARFLAYGQDADKIMDEFEAFRKLNIKNMLWEVNSSISSLERMKQYLETEEGEGRL